MSKHVITESGMDFIADTDDTYHIEKSSAFAGVGRSVKTIEFIRKMGDTLWFVEAKPIFPDEEDKGKRGEWIRAICDKFLHSLNLYCAIKLEIVIDTLPDTFTGNKVLFVLVIKEQSLDRCGKIQEVIKTKLLPYLRIWKTNILVINHATAKQYQLVDQEEP
jgi:hypothetical protein